MSDDAGAPVQNDVEVPGPSSFDGWNPQISLALPSVEERAAEATRPPWHDVGWITLISIVFKNVVGLGS